MLDSHYAIELLARERQSQLLDEARHDRMIRELTRRPAAGRQNGLEVLTPLATYFRRLRTRMAGGPRRTLTQEPAS